MLKKIWSIAALLSSAAALNACQTSAGKPVNCLPAFEMKGRCAKVKPIIKIPTPVRPKTTAPKKHIAAPAWARQPAQNVYGQPL